MPKDPKKKPAPAPFAAKTTKKKGFPGAPEPEELEDVKKPSSDPSEGGKAGAASASTGIPKKTSEDEENAAADAERELQDEINDNFKLAWEAEKEWIDAAKEDIRFKAGEQWAPEDKQKLASQARPCLTFNKIAPIIKLLTGHFIQNSARIQVAPEGGEDQKFSDVADRVISHVDEHAQIEFNFGYLFSGGETTGRAHIELHIDYEKDPIFGHLRSIYHGRPGTILMDPRGSSYDLNQDRQFGFKLIKKTKAELKDLYPDKKDAIDEISDDSENPSALAGEEGDANNYGNDKRSTTVGLNKSAGGGLINKASISQYHVKEYWRFKRVEKWYVYFVDKGDMPEFASEEEAKAEVDKRKDEYLRAGGLPEAWATVMRKRQRKEMHVAVRCGGVILADGKSPFEPYYTGFPFFQFAASLTPEAEKVVDQVQGIVRGLKDPQREKNKARSQFLHIINTSANAGWIIDDNALTQQQKEDLKNFGSTPGIVIEKKSLTTVQRIEPTPAPVAQQVREKAAKDDFTEVSGINPDLLATDESSNPSGKAIALRIRQGLTILEPDFRNFRYTKKLVGTAIMQMVPTLFDVPKLKKILGDQYVRTNGLDDAFLKRFLIEIEDLRYNVKIAEQGDTKTMREETFEDLMQMLSHGTPIPFDVLADFMQIPNKAEVIQKVKDYQEAQMAAAVAAKGGAPGAPAAA